MKKITVMLMGLLLAGLLPASPFATAHAASIAVDAINALGIDLLHQTAETGSNVLLSPYSIQMAMAMTCAGASGQTREEMSRVLHYPQDQSQVDASFAALQAEINGMITRESAQAETRYQQFISYMAGIEQREKQAGNSYHHELVLGSLFTNQLTTLTTVNRLYGQQGYDFRPAYRSLLSDTYQAPFETWDFIHNAAAAVPHINEWVQQQTQDRIRNLIPMGALPSATRLVLVNAIYLKAYWLAAFESVKTKPAPFHLADGTAAQVPTMVLSHDLEHVWRGGYLSRLIGGGYTVIVLPYKCPELQFVIMLPDSIGGLPGLEAGLTPEMFTNCTNLPSEKIDLYLPKLKLEPPRMLLADDFQSLGMKSAFNMPSGSANFDCIAPRRPDDYLYISQIYHKTFLELDESGTEAAAATAVTAMMGSAAPLHPVPPVEIHVDHPFLFFIQHVPTGACLFLGQVTDPR